MKKKLMLFLTVFMMFSLTACGGTNNRTSGDAGDEKENKNVIEVSSGDYEELLAGGLNKEQFAFILAHAPAELAEDAYSMDDLSRLLLYISDILSGGEKSYISITGWTEGYDANMYYNVADVNNMIKILTDFQFSEENNGECPAATVSGDTLAFCYATPSKGYSAEIESAVIEDDVMTVVYKVHITTFEDGEWDEMRTAVLSKNDDGLYQIQTIKTDEVLVPSWQEQYKEKLALHSESAECYTLHDMDGDGNVELIIATPDPDFPEYSDWTIYTCGTENGVIKEVYCSYSPGGVRAVVYVNPFGPGVVDAETSRFNGETYYTEVKVVDGEVSKSTINYFTWDQEAEREEYDANFTQQLEWYEMSDVSPLN